nr:hypothetical protein [Acetivibrio ethanolgignens]
MNKFFRYLYKESWVTVRKEGTSYIIVDPIDLRVIKINKIQAAILYKMAVKEISIEEIKNVFRKHGIAGNAVDEFIENVKKNNLL